MPENRQPSRPIDAYKAMIDQLVTETSQSVHERLIVDEGVWLKTRDEEAANALVRSLTGEQRRILGRMLHDERTGAIHDVLAVLTWWIATRDVGLMFRGEPMPVELGGQGLHGDYIGRLSGLEWPESDDSRGL
jgi:hypothetical protein